MEPIENIACGCEARTRSAREGGLPLWAGLILAPLAAGLWWLVYTHLKPAADYITFRVLPLAPGSHLGEAIAFFLYDTPKVMMLLVLVVFGVGVIRSYFSPERTRALLVGKSLLAGNVLAALLGVVTPFCSCSAVPLFIGFVTAGVPLGVTFSFLIAAPMVNEIALGLLYGLVGWKVAALYAATGLSIAVAAGWTIGRLRMEGHIEDWVSQMNAAGGDADQDVFPDPAEDFHHRRPAIADALGPGHPLGHGRAGCGVHLRASVLDVAFHPEAPDGPSGSHGDAQTGGGVKGHHFPAHQSVALGLCPFEKPYFRFVREAAPATSPADRGGRVAGCRKPTVIIWK